MPDIKLGPQESEVILPLINWMGGAPNLPVDSTKTLETTRMSDSSIRMNFIGQKKKWPFSWECLTQDKIDTLKELNDYKQILKFQNGWESETWYDVYINSFNYDRLTDISTEENVYYSCEMTLEEV
jgi:hypothetical protein